VRNLNSTVEELKNEQTMIKASLNQQIRDVCREMLIAPVNNQQINLSTNSQSVNSIESNNTKK
jgi:signal recognition particle GTPase